MSDLLNSASLVMIPSGYKEDVVYSQIPTDGSGDLSFTRASNGTRINSAGLVEVCPWNLAQYSEDFNTGWTLANVTVTANDITAPNGTLTADKLTISSNGNDVKQTISVLPNTVYTWSFYVYGGTALGQQGRFYDNTNSTNIEYYNYSSSVVLGAWVKIERTFTTPSGCYEIQAWVLAATSTIGTMWAWGCQLNIGSTAKPYFPTTDRLNVPRLTYQNGGGGCPSLLLEKQSTNLATYSEDATQWNTGSNVGSITRTANNTTSPDGTQNADKVQFPAVGSGSEYAVLFFPFTASATTYTGSVWLKGENGGEVVWINFTKDGVNYTQTLCTLTTSWQRFTLSSTLTSGADNFQIGVDTRDSAESAKPAQTIYVWGRQLEASSYPTSYIPTTSASATRVADACYKTGISSLIGQTEGSVFFDFTVDTISAQTNDPVLWYMKDGGTGERYVELYSDGRLIYLEYNGATIATITKTGLTIGRHKCAIGYANDDMVFYVDGVQIGTDVSGTPSGFSTFGLQYYNATYSGQQKVNQVILFPTRLTNAELASLTTI